MKSIRSFLFVPGNRDVWREKAASYGADALILDLEDSVPVNQKDTARQQVANRVPFLAERGQRVYVRINRSPHLYSFADIMDVVRPGLEGIVLPKPNGPEDIAMAAALISEAELTKGLPHGMVQLVPTLETARSLQFAFDIASHPRVVGITGAAAKNADIARSVGFVWSRGGREALGFKSRVVIAARAAGKLPIGGIWQEVHDLEGYRAYSRADRELGMSGDLLLHPSAVAIANEIYSPTADEVAYYEGMIRAFDEANAAGRAAVIYDGEHIDIAHVKTARDLVAMAHSLIRPTHR